MDWLNKDTDKPILKLPKECIGFVYLIEYESGMRYIGKKSIYSTTTVPAKSNGEPRKGHVRFCKKRVYRDSKGKIITKKSDRKGVKGKLEPYEELVSESNWREYLGSSNLIPETDKPVRKVILSICSNKMSLTYLEVSALMRVHASASSKFYNKVIGREYYDNCLDGVIPYDCLTQLNHKPKD